MQDELIIGKLQNSFFLLSSVNLLQYTLYFCVKYKWSLVSAALASEPVKSLPSKKSWVFCITTFNLKVISTLFSLVKCKRLSAVPITSSMTPVHVITSVFCDGSMFLCVHMQVVLKILKL